MSISGDQFVDSLSSSGLLSDKDVAALQEQLSAAGESQDGESLARSLVEAGQLTEYQAAAICEGKTDLLVFGEYTVFDRIGAGGMGEVLKGRHRTMDREVAIKVLPEKQMDTPDAVKRFQKEVRAAAKLNHPNIVTAHDAGHKGDLHYLVMEYVEGRDLADIVDNDGPLPVDQAMDAIRQAARGLEYAHRRGITHRDIKPANLLLDNEGTVKILDMGLARVEGGAGAPDAGEGLTSTGQIMGTSDYIPPEQAMDTRKADARSDVYSLGCTLYRLLTGNTPYGGDTVMKKIMAHMNEPIPPLREARPEVPEALEDLYRRMLAKEPNDRSQSMTEVISDLETILRGDSATADSGSATTGTPPDAELASFFNQMGGGSASPTVTRGGGHKTNTAKTAVPLKETTPVPEETIDLAQQDDTSRSVSAAEAAEMKTPAAQPATATQPAAAAKVAAAKPRRRASARRKKQALPLLLIGVGAGIALIGAAVVAAILYIQTNYGTIVVDARDENIQVVVKQGGQEIYVADAKNHWRIEAKAGEYHVEIKGGHDRLTLDKDTVTVTRGGELRVKVTLNPAAVAGKGSPPPLAVAPFDAAQARRHQQAWATYLGLPVERDVSLPGGVKLTLVLIPPGEFLMGTSNAEQQWAMEEAKAAEDPRAIARIRAEIPHPVRITQPFYLGKYEVAQDQWQAVMDDNPSQSKDDPRRPVEQVSWEDVRPFLSKLNAVAANEGLQFVLPTEAQWEYACRAGTTEAYCCGPDSEALERYAWYKDNANGGTHAVGGKNPNAWGIYDMHGNVSEWCADFYADDYYRQSPPDDPVGPAEGWDRAVRGGLCLSPPRDCRSAARYERPPTDRYNRHGFRLAAVLPDKVQATSDLTLPAGEAGTKPAPPPDGKYATLSNGWRIGKPANLGSTVNWGGDDQGPHISANGCLLVFHSNRRGHQGVDLWESRRASPDQPFTAPVNLGAAVNSERKDMSPALSDGGRRLYLNAEIAERVDGRENHDLWTSFRATIDEPFGEPVEVPGNVNGRSLDLSPFVTQDGLTLLFASDRPGGQGSADLWMCERMTANEDFGDPVNLGPIVNSTANEGEPALSADGLVLFFNANRKGGQGRQDIWMCTRASSKDDFGQPVNLGSVVNSQYDDRGPCLSADGRTFYFSSDRPGGHGSIDLWQCVVQPPQVAGVKGQTMTPSPAVAPFSPAQAKQHQQAWAEHLDVPVEYTNSIGMKFTLIPPGEFRMGSSQEEIAYLLQKAAELGLPDWYTKHVHTEGPDHTARLDKPFYFGKFEVTAEFRSFVNAAQYKTESEQGTRLVKGFDQEKGQYVEDAKYSWQNYGYPRDHTHPVGNVSWNDAVAFCRWLEGNEGLRCRLPLEREWEYACRAGTTTRWHSGDQPDSVARVGNFSDESFASAFPKAEKDAVCLWNDSFPRSAPVGSFAPNAFGLHDMHGNVWEWCEDFNNYTVYEQYARGDFTSPTTGEYGNRARRGGNYCAARPWDGRSAYRDGSDPHQGHPTIGFRVVCEIPDTASGKAHLRAAASAPPAAAAPTGDWQPLFDGKTLDGWHGDPDVWTVSKGAIIGQLKAPAHTFLSTRKSYGDFILKVQFWRKDGNTGVNFRSKQVDEYHIAGPQADIAGTGIGLDLGIWDGEGWKCLSETDRQQAAAHYHDGWNEYTITCVGPRVKVELNGHTTVDYAAGDGEIPGEGVIALQLYARDTDARVAFKDILVQEVSGSVGRE